MAKARRPVRMSRAAQMGLLALAFLAAAALAAFFAVKFVRGVGGYEFGIRFKDAAGVGPGDQVYLNGVNIGNVTKATILPDASVEFIINIFRDTGIPKGSTFTVQTSFTGTSKVEITSPVGRTETLPKRVLPLEEQPVGSPPLSFEKFMGQSQILRNRANSMLAQARPYARRLSAHLNNSRENGQAITAQMQSTFPAVMANLQSTIARAKANAQAAQSALTDGNQAKIAAIASSLQQTTAQMKQTSASLATFKSDPQMQANVRDASGQLKAASANLAALSHEMQQITGDPQTKAQLRDASARLRALLKSF